MITGLSEKDLMESEKTLFKKKKKKFIRKKAKRNLDEDILFSHNVALEEVKNRLRKINKLRGKDSNEFSKIPQLKKRKP